MYKVKPKDMIPVRTIEEALSMEGQPYKVQPDHAKLEKYWNALGVKFNQAHAATPIMRTVYRFVDEAIKGMAGFSVCAKGCSHCCKLDVGISKIEALYIARNYKGPVKAGEYSRTAPRNSEYCPFHSESGDCNIYALRPLACRWFFAYDDPKHCEDPLTKHIVSAQGGLPRGEFFPEIRRYVNEAVKGEHKDIREYFK